MSTPKEDLLKKIEAIKDEDTLKRILHFVEEEALIYKTALSPEQHNYVMDSIDTALKESQDGKGRSFDEFFKSLD